MLTARCLSSLLRPATHLPQGVSAAIACRRWLHSDPEAAYSGDILRHRHFDGTVSYDEAQRVHEAYHGEFMRWKRLKVDNEKRGAALPAGQNEPAPIVLTFEAEPTYTLGRRQAPLTTAESAVLTRDLDVHLRRGDGRRLDLTARPVIRSTMRGGLTTYHGPGQLVIWPILDMRSSRHAPFSVSSYAATLESTTRTLLLAQFGIGTVTTPDAPGVWVPDPRGRPGRKIAALGVHHRRHVTGLGMSLNVDVPTRAGEDIGGNPWARFDPCGLKDTPGVTSEVTSIAREVGREGEAWDTGRIAHDWVRLFREALVRR